MVVTSIAVTFEIHPAPDLIFVTENLGILSRGAEYIIERQGSLSEKS